MAINLGDAVLFFKGDTSNLDAAATSSMDMVKGLGVGMTAAGVAITGALGLGVSEAMNFESAMAAVASLGTEGMGELEASVRKSAVAYGLDLTEAAKGTYDMISSGATALTAPKILEDAARAAAAGQTDLTTSVQLGMGMANAFGISLKDLSGVFDASFIAVNKGVMTFEELAQSAGRSAPAFAANKISLDEMLASAAALTLGAVPASEAFTQLNAIVAGFTRQGQSAILESRGLAGALKWLVEQTGGNKTEMLAFLGSTEALSAALALTGNQATAFSDIMGQMKDKMGATQAAFDIIAEKDPSFAWKQLKAQMQDVSITVGQALLPTLKRIMDAVSPMISGITEWTKSHKDLTANIVLGAAAFGGLMLALGPVLIALPGIVTAVGLVGAAFTGIAFGPAVAVVAAIAGVGYAGYKLVQNWGDIKGALSDWTQPKEAANEAGKVIYNDFTPWMDALSGHIQDTKTTASDWSQVTQASKKAAEEHGGFWQELGEVIMSVMDAILIASKAIIFTFQLLGDAIISVAVTVGTAWKQVFDEIFGMFGGWLFPKLDPSGGTVAGQEARASGGPVDGGTPYLVGEEGPEMFVPNTSGRIINARDTARGGSGGSVTINFPNLTIREEADIGRISQLLAREIPMAMTRALA